MHYMLRLCVPDRPGAFASVATALGAAGIDIVALDVIDRADGVAVDDMRVATSMAASGVRSVLESVTGVTVEALSPEDPDAEIMTATALAAAVAEAPLEPVAVLVHGLPAAFRATWAMAVADGPEGLVVTAASDAAPPCPAGLQPPFFPLRKARRAPQAAWMPVEWRGPVGSRLELAAARLHSPSTAVFVARPGGPRFRQPELRRLAEVARIAVAVAAPTQGMVVTTL
jgi:ACT domain